MKGGEERLFDVPTAIYKKFCEAMPIATVDFIIVRRGKTCREFMLGRRKDKPYKGKWFIPGGRIFKGESDKTAIVRQLKRETNMTSKNVRFLFNHTIFNPPNNFGIRCHTICHIYKVRADGGAGRATHDNSSMRWFDKIDPRWPKPTREILELAGFRH